MTKQMKKQAKAEKEQMYKTVVSAEAKRRRISQQKITSCVKFEDYIYIYIQEKKKEAEVYKALSSL